MPRSSVLYGKECQQFPGLGQVAAYNADCGETL
jgi:hypothetical protein